MKEIWKDIKGYEDSYQVSNYGNVKSLKRKVCVAHHNRNGYRTVSERILKNNNDGRGYYFVRLSKKGIVKFFSVHRLVLLNFLPNPKNKRCVNHKDCNPKNNHINNLEWCTHKENSEHAKKHGKYVFSEERKKRMSESAKGRKHKFKERLQSRKPIFKIRNGLPCEYYDSIKTASLKNNIPCSNICHCLKKHTKTAGGFLWEYV